MGPPEETLFGLGTQLVDDLLEHEPFPGGTDFGVTIKVSPVADPEESVEYPTIANVDLRRLDLPLSHIRVPRRQLLDDKSSTEYVEVVPDRLVGYPERASELR